jgi:gamma-glutamyltranspeptidase
MPPGRVNDCVFPVPHKLAASRQVGVKRPNDMAIASPGLVAHRPGREINGVRRVADIMLGGGHAIMLSDRGTPVGVADPRRDGAAMEW